VLSKFATRFSVVIATPSAIFCSSSKSRFANAVVPKYSKRLSDAMTKATCSGSAGDQDDNRSQKLLASNQRRWRRESAIVSQRVQTTGSVVDTEVTLGRALRRSWPGFGDRLASGV